MTARAAILNQGQGAWAFSELAAQLAEALWVDVVDEPVEVNYVLFWDGRGEPPPSFNPLPSIEIAADKRTQAELFDAASVPMPTTVLLDTEHEVSDFVSSHNDRRWVLKYPIGCGAAGHRIITPGMPFRDDWPTPFIVQQFVEMDDPAVYRIYCAGGRLFGWNERRFGDAATRRSPFGAHATGASYGLLDTIPDEAARAAIAALDAAGLTSSFGCADLLHSDTGWVVIEVGTDGLYNYVDREVPEPLATELDRRIAEAFWALVDRPPPWGPDWHRRPT